MKNPARGQILALAAVTLLAGILIGVVGAHSFDIVERATEENSDPQATADSAAAQLRASLNILLVERTYLSTDAMRATYEESDELAALTVALGRNSDVLAASLAAVYDGVDDDVLTDSWQDRLDGLNAYALAAREQDQEAMQAAEEDMAVANTSLAELLGGHTETEESLWLDLLELSTDQMRQVFNASVAGNHSEAYEALSQLRELMAELAQELTQSAIAANPDRF